MQGAILGDLAAWTWKNDHDKFYPKLISDDAQLSDIGRAVLASFALQSSHLPSVEWATISDSVSTSMRSSCMFSRDVDSEWEDFISGTVRIIPPSVKSTMNIANSIVAGWFERSQETAAAWEQRFHGSKEDYYFTQVAEIIYKLRHGATKAEAIKDTSCIVDWNDHHEEEPHYVSPLFYACKAWKCFYYAFDYTSAIHNAARCSCHYPHILAVITGAFAEAMYGCEFMLLKEKYQPNATCQELYIPKRIKNLCNKQFADIRQYENHHRYFFPKNSALTNVELHRWTDIENPWKDHVIDENTYHIILEAFYPDWERRHQLYLDNGWVYCCRSNVVLCRFQLIKQADGSYRISKLQKSEDRYRYMWGLPDALYNVNVRGIRFADALDHCKYYQGELKNPYHDNTAESNFWHGEMMFCTTRQDLEHWKSVAQSPEQAKRISTISWKSEPTSEQLAMLCYTEILFGKFNPYDDFAWICKY